MPKPKRQKGGAKKPAPETAPAQPPVAAAEATKAATAASESHNDNQWAPLARKHWLGKARAPKRVKNDVIKGELWDALERDGFRYGSLLALESLQAVENYLWPSFSDDASNYHVLLLVLLANVKKREQLDTWGEFSLGSPVLRRGDCIADGSMRL
ncbi:hypothetical protein IMZ48_07310 [Candidatus Bathyarchaeota archaeon]|nr:hypothetical protein [Candidatus Bathyarchaeota archaeon]